MLIKLVRFTVVPCDCNQGPCPVVAEEGKSECSRASLDDASNILVRDVENSRHQRVYELQWLRLMFVLYPKSVLILSSH